MSRAGDYSARLATDRSRINERLDDLLPREDTEPVSLHEAMRHSVLSGGKRMRGIFCIAVHALFGNPRPEAALDAACALELLHAYTLIHDDLPALDDDDTRRGRPSCHAVYGEAVSILAGDALQALAFQTLAGCRADNAAVLEAISLLSRAAGSRYLVGGQVADLEGEEQEATEEKVQFIHMRKTAELIAASFGIGAVLAGAERGDVDEMLAAGRDAGYAFQIVDDLLDLGGDAQVVGKELRKDMKKGKITHPAVHGANGSRDTAKGLIRSALEAVERRKEHGYLRHLLALIVERVS
jgi:geranylgeranyl diphosphate synthase type II